MPKIKNTRELVLRARGHARQDHITQGTYGSGEVNGFAEFRGCVIGCLATPHRKRDLRDHLRELVGGAGTYDGNGLRQIFNDGQFPGTQTRQPSQEGPQDMLKRLQRDFGICPELARCVEAIFEGIEHHGDAINFIPEFAAALNEGASIAPAKLRPAWYRIAFGDVSDENASIGFDHTKGAWAEPGAVRDSFLAWLREQH